MQIVLLIIQLITYSHASNLNPKLDIPEVQCDQSLTQEIQDKISRSFSSLECWSITKLGGCAVTSAGTAMALAGQAEIKANKMNQVKAIKIDYAKLGATYAKLFAEEKSGWKVSPGLSSGINERGVEFKWITPATKYGPPDDAFSGRLIQKLGSSAAVLRGTGLLTAFFGVTDLLQTKGDTISKCAGLAKEVEAYVSTMEENGKCSTVPAIGSKEIEFLKLPSEKQSELLKSNKYLCSHFKNVSLNFELVTQAQNDLWFKDVSVRDIKCSPSGDLNYTLSSKNFSTAVQFERKQSENTKTLKVTYNQGSDKISSELEYSKDPEWKDLTKVTWDNKLPAWRGSRSVTANRFDAASEWEGSSIRDSVRHTYLNEFWGGKAEKCCSMAGGQRASCIADLDVRPKKKNSGPGGIK